MSIGWMNWILGDRATPALEGPKNGNRLVLLALANHADVNGFCWPSLATIQSETALSEKPVKQAVAWLVQNGYITRIVNGAPAEFSRDPGRRPNLYQLRREAETEGRIDPPSEPPTEGRIDPPTEGRIVPDGQLIPLTGTIKETVRDIARIDPFETFWAEYPRKVGKPKAKSAHASAAKRAKPDVILDGLHRWLPHWAKTDPRFIPHATTWLNRDGWADEIPASSNASPATGWEHRRGMQFDEAGNLIRRAP